MTAGAKPWKIDGYTVIQSDWTNPQAIADEVRAINAGPAVYQSYLNDLIRQRARAWEKTKADTSDVRLFDNEDK